MSFDQTTDTPDAEHQAIREDELTTRLRDAAETGPGWPLGPEVEQLRLGWYDLLRRSRPQAGRVPSASPSASAREHAHLLINALEDDETYRHVALDVRIMVALAERRHGRPLAQIALTERARALMHRVEIERSVRRSVLEEGTYSATKVGDLLGSTSKNPRDKASRLRQRGELLGVEVDGSVLYPAFQINAARAELRPGVAETNQAMNAKADGWAVASWWLTPHARLGEGVRPADLALDGDAASWRSWSIQHTPTDVPDIEPPSEPRGTPQKQVIERGTPLFRIHHPDFPGNAMNPTRQETALAGSRFDRLDGDYSYLYVAGDIEGAMAERVFRDLRWTADPEWYRGVCGRT